MDKIFVFFFKDKKFYQYVNYNLFFLSNFFLFPFFFFLSILFNLSKINNLFQNEVILIKLKKIIYLIFNQYLFIYFINLYNFYIRKLNCGYE